MPSRRAFLSFLGLAPVAAPAALASLAEPALATFGADATDAGVTIAAGPVVTPEMCKAWFLRAYNEMTAAECEAPLAAVSQAHCGRFLPRLGRSLLAPAPLGDRATRDGADRVARGDQGDGGDAATAAPSQSVEKVVPEATGDGDGLTSASGPGIVPGSNSPAWAPDGRRAAA